MIRRILVTLCVSLLLTGANAQPSNPHVIRISATYDTAFPSPHVLLGIAVLGHNVGRLERGWIVKQKGEGYLHIDWTRSGDWTGLTKSVEGPRDLSQPQLDAVVGGIVQLGVPAASITSWRVAAPVGYDGFQEGDKVLMIGEILIDLGTVEQANATLPKLYDAIVTKDALDHFPHTNVRPVEYPYYLLDCNALRIGITTQARADADRVLSAIEASAHVAATFQAASAATPNAVLCSRDARPNFYNVSGAFNSAVSADDLKPLQGATVSYTIAGHENDTRLVADAGDLNSGSSSQAFDLPEPYVGTIGKGEIPIAPEWYLFHIHYGITYRAGAEHDADVAASRSKLAFFTGLIHAPNELTSQTGVEPHLAPETLDIYMRVRGSDRATIEAIVKNYVSEKRFMSQLGTTTFLVNCELPKRQALLQAIDHARAKAGVLASALHAHVGELAAANTGVISDFGTICGQAPQASLASMMALAPLKIWGGLFHAPKPSFSTSVNAAWLLSGGRQAPAQLKSYVYQSTIHADSPSFDLELKALRQTALEAIVDNPNVTSMYETGPSMSSYNGSTTASDTLVVLR